MNDLSLNGQFPTLQAVRSCLEPMLEIRHKRNEFRERFFISRTLANQQATADDCLYEAIQKLSDKDFKTIAAKWLSNGPFWNDNRCSHQDDYFEFLSSDVTEQGLGEAARRKIIGTDVSAFSLMGSGKNCEETPLKIQHGLTGSVYGQYDIHNIWDIPALESSVRGSSPIPQNWNELFFHIRERFEDDVCFSDDAINDLLSRPFQVATMNRIIELLSFLTMIVKERDQNGAWTHRGQQLYKTYFVGSNPQFVNEADPYGNLWFDDPEDASRRIHCTWHGRMSSMLGRVHFEWPLPAHQKKVKVVYIGEKVNKT
ncbi:hypothetical protein GC177_00615 [bacterium]|nr:hypothetical protein [bacterium]